MEHFAYARDSNDSRGVANLIKNQINYDIFEKYSSEGRILLIQLRIWDREILILNVYASNFDEFHFFENLVTKVMEFECRKIVYRRGF